MSIILSQDIMCACNLAFLPEWYSDPYVWLCNSGELELLWFSADLQTAAGSVRYLDTLKHI